MFAALRQRCVTWQRYTAHCVTLNVSDGRRHPSCASPSLIIAPATALRCYDLSADGHGRCMLDTPRRAAPALSLGNLSGARKLRNPWHARLKHSSAKTKRSMLIKTHWWRSRVISLQ